MAQLHFNKWLDIADVFEAFSCKIGDSHVFRRSGIKVVEGFSIMSKLAVNYTYDDKLFQNKFFSQVNL